jgi:predicted phage-related endonuclease
MDYGPQLNFQAGITEEQLQARKGRYGSSHAACLLGVDPYMGPRGLYESLVNPTTVVPNERMIHGKYQEPATIAIYANLHSRKIWSPGSAFLENHPLFIDHVDGLSGGLDADVPDRCVEAKDVMGIFRDQYGPEWTNKVPIAKIPQCIFHMGFWGMQRCDLIVMLGGVLKCYQIDFDQGLFDQIIEAGERFHRDHIVTRKPPPADASKRTTDILQGTPQASMDVRAAEMEEDALISELVSAQTQVRTWQKEEARIKNQLKDAIGEDAGVKGLTATVTWRRGKDSIKIDWKGLAESYEPTADDIDNHTVTNDGTRRFTVKEH